MSDAFPPSVVSRATVVRIDNVDTDVITPIARVLEGPEAVVRFAFEPLRFDEHGDPRPDDPFANSAGDSRAILIAGRNFGCGSSRETAAVAVRGMGFRVVIAASYGDIFYSNCLKNGVLAVRLTPDVVEQLMADADALEAIKVDLPAQTVQCGGIHSTFEIGALQKEMLLSGLDEIGMMRSRSAARSAFVARDRLARPWVRDRVRVD